MPGRSQRYVKPRSIAGPVVTVVLLSEPGEELTVEKIREATDLSKTQIYGVMRRLVEKGMVTVKDPGKVWVVCGADS